MKTVTLTPDEIDIIARTIEGHTREYDFELQVNKEHFDNDPGLKELYIQEVRTCEDLLKKLEK